MYKPENDYTVTINCKEVAHYTPNSVYTCTKHFSFLSLLPLHFFATFETLKYFFNMKICFVKLLISICQCILLLLKKFITKFSTFLFHNITDINIAYIDIFLDLYKQPGLCLLFTPDVIFCFVFECFMFLSFRKIHFFNCLFCALS